MDEEKRDYPMDYTEEEETVAPEITDEELRETRRDYGEDVEALPEEQVTEGLRERESPFVEEEEYRAHDVSAIEAEDIRDREAKIRENEEEFRETQTGSTETEKRDRERSAMDKELVPLLKEGEATEFRSRWQDIQTDFIDDPRHSVETADELVARVINSITENFASERSALEEQWNRGEEASTEDLRIAIKRYRSFFNRLLALESMGSKDLK